MSLLQAPIALTPASGAGYSIGESALEPGDIIVSTTTAAVSGVIRVGSGSVVSHTALYAGGGEVIEAIGSGVVRRPVAAAYADAALAVAFRVPGIRPAEAQAVVAEADRIRAAGTPYSIGGALLSTDKVLCRLAGPRPSGFFCSQLVLEAYARAGRPLSELPSHCGTPEDVVQIAEQRLEYAGHLLGNTSWFPVLAP